MRLGPVVGIATLFLGSALARAQRSDTAQKTIYFLHDDAHRQWCGYGTRSLFDERNKALQPWILGGADYSDGLVSTIYVTETDETGDWGVNDEYTVDKQRQIQSLKRIINVLPEHNSEEQSFLMRNGRAIKQPSKFRQLGPGNVPDKSVEWFKPPRVITKLEAFPFSALIGSRRNEVWSKGEVCILSK